MVRRDAGVGDGIMADAQEGIPTGFGNLKEASFSLVSSKASSHSSENSSRSSSKSSSADSRTAPPC